MSIYQKPYFDEIWNAKPLECHYPYQDQLIDRYEIFPLLVMDGGAFFFLKELVGGEADGRAILDAYESGKLLETWSGDGKIDWMLTYRNASDSKLRNSLEEIVWIHRLYFLLPLARKFFLTGDEKWALKWYGAFEDWALNNPYRTYEGDPYEGDLVWFDMQVCWRLLVLEHSVHLLAKSDSLGRSRWKSIYDSIEFHADRLLHEGQEGLALGSSGNNHFLQKGTALLYAGTLFPGFMKSKRYMEAGREIIRHQMKRQILPDGGSIESSPSYSHFIARQYVEAFLLMENNGVEGPEGLEDSINKQYEWMLQASDPSGKTLQINDSFVMDAARDIEIVSGIFPLKITRKKTGILFRESNFAVLHNNRFDIYVDAMKLTEDHQHLGKPNVLLYADKLPLLVDSGCCSYDRHLREDYLMGRFAHNVVVIPEFEDENVPVFVMEDYFRSLSAQMEINGFKSQVSGGAVDILYSQEREVMKFTWQRSIVMEEARVRISDSVRFGREITVRQVFHLAPWNLGLSKDKCRATVFFKDRDISIYHAKTGCSFQLEYRPAMNCRNEMDYSPTLVTELKGCACDFEVVLALDE